MLPLEWISIEKEYPPEFWPVYILNGKKIYWGQYDGNEWETVGRGEFGLDNVYLHKVTKWAQNPKTKIGIPFKDLFAFRNRAREYNHKKKFFNIRFHHIILN